MKEMIALSVRWLETKRCLAWVNRALAEPWVTDDRPTRELLEAIKDGIESGGLP